MTTSNKSLENLTRYKFEFGQDSCDCTVIDSIDYEFEGGYLKFEEAVKEHSDIIQKLKDEIAAIIPILIHANDHMIDDEFDDCIKKLRQLSSKETV